MLRRLHYKCANAVGVFVDGTSSNIIVTWFSFWIGQPVICTLFPIWIFLSLRLTHTSWSHKSTPAHYHVPSSWNGLPFTYTYHFNQFSSSYLTTNIESCQMGHSYWLVQPCNGDNAGWSCLWDGYLQQVPHSKLLSKIGWQVQPSVDASPLDSGAKNL